jgi:hypothetical protein
MPARSANVIAGLLVGYGNVDITPFVWYFSLADVPGVTVEAPLGVTVPGGAVS